MVISNTRTNIYSRQTENFFSFANVLFSLWSSFYLSFSPVFTHHVHRSSCSWSVSTCILQALCILLMMLHFLFIYKNIILNSIVEHKWVFPPSLICCCFFFFIFLFWIYKSITNYRIRKQQQQHKQDTNKCKVNFWTILNSRE